MTLDQTFSRQKVWTWRFEDQRNVDLLFMLYKCTAEPTTYYILGIVCVLMYTLVPSPRPDNSFHDSAAQSRVPPVSADSTAMGNHSKRQTNFDPWWVLAVSMTVSAVLSITAHLFTLLKLLYDFRSFSHLNLFFRFNFRWMGRYKIMIVLQNSQECLKSCLRSLEASHNIFVLILILGITRRQWLWTHRRFQNRRKNRVSLEQ